MENRLLRPPPKFGGDAEMRQLAAIISNDIYQESPNVRYIGCVGLVPIGGVCVMAMHRFDDIIRLEEAKRLLCEAVQLPLRFPTIFTALLRYTI